MSNFLERFGGEVIPVGTQAYRTRDNRRQYDEEPRRLYGVRIGDRLVMRPSAWQSQGNIDPNIRHGLGGYVPQIGVPRVRPRPWMEEPDEEIIKPSNRVYTYSVAFYAEFPDTSFADVVAYMQKDAEAVCYYLNTSSGNLAYSFTNVPPSYFSQILGSPYTAPATFRAWWNQLTTGAPEETPTLSFGVTNNNGAGGASIFVNGTEVTWGNTHFVTVGANADAGYGTGDQSAYGDGALAVVE